MIYLATYNRKSEMLYSKSKSLLFIDAKERLALEKVIALVRESRKAISKKQAWKSSVRRLGTLQR